MSVARVQHARTAGGDVSPLPAVLALCSPGAHPPPHAEASLKPVLAYSVADLIQELHGRVNPLVLIQAGTLDEDEIEIASRLRDLPSRPCVALLGAGDRMEIAVSTARRLGLAHVLPPDCLCFPDELALWLRWMADGGPEPGIATHLSPSARTETFVVRSRDDKPRIIEAVVAHLAPLGKDCSVQFDLRLVLEEALNNAIYHAFLDVSGREKYSIERFESLAGGENIRVQIGIDDRFIALSVSDDQGVLRRDRILAKIERQMGSRGLLDENGRGLYLTYSLSGRLIFNLIPGRLTECVCLFPIAGFPMPGASPHRPLLIFERPAPPAANGSANQVSR